MTLYPLQILIPNSASQTFPFVAVFLFQLYQGLCVAGVCHFQSTFLPHSYYMVVFSFQLVEYVEGSFAKTLVLDVSAVGKKHRHGGVDE